MMKLAAPSTVKSRATFTVLASVRPLVSRHYATHTDPRKSQSSGSGRRSVAPSSHNEWRGMMERKKVAQAARTGFDFSFILLGLCLTASVFYLLFQEVFAPDSKVANFSRSVDLVKKDPECQRLLGDPKKIFAHGEETYNKWRRARPIASTITTDRDGVDHLMMKFYVEGPLNRGLVQLHMIRHPKQGDGDFEYKYLFVDIKGHNRIYLKNADEEKKKAAAAARKKTKFLGINWG
ncbi:hypothetical protein VUR80DRAFT_2324 [Thermomyces stellatus]